MNRKSFPVELLVLIASAAVLIWLLMVKPVVGVAGNGDFERIMGTVGLHYMDSSMTDKDTYFGYFIREFRLSGLGLGGYVSTELVLVFLAKGISWLMFQGSLFDIRTLAFLYMTLFLAAAWLIIKYNKRDSAWTHLMMAALFVVLFTDVGYAAYFNSLYGEPVSFVFTLLTFAFALALVKREKPSRRLLTGFFISALFLIGAKVQNAPAGLFLSVLCLRLGALRAEYVWKKTVLWFSVILLLASIAIYFSVPKEIRVINEYQTVFYGVLKDSPTPEKDLQELGIPGKFAVNAGTNYFEKAPIPQTDPSFASEYHPNFSQMKVVLFYLKHPDRFVHKLEKAAEQGMSIRPYYLGNYELSEGRGYGAISYAFSTWSEFKRNVLPHKLWFIAAFYAVYYLVLLLYYFGAYRLSQRLVLEILGLVGIVGLIQFVTPILGDGEADLGKHLFGFNVIFDMMVFVSALWIVEQIVRMLTPKRRRYY